MHRLARLVDPYQVEEQVSVAGLLHVRAISTLLILRTIPRYPPADYAYSANWRWAAVPERQSVVEGDSPKTERYTTAKRPGSEKP